MSYNQQKCLAAEILTALGVVAFVAMVGIAFIMNKRNKVPEYSSISMDAPIRVAASATPILSIVPTIAAQGFLRIQLPDATKQFAIDDDWKCHPITTILLDEPDTLATLCERE